MRVAAWLIAFFCLASSALSGQPRRILYVTQAVAFRHDSLPVSVEVMSRLAPDRIAVTAAADTALITAESLKSFDAVVFFTTGELPLSDSQKTALLEFVRSGKGFAGVHSATDTLYTWPEYRTLIGGTFDGHPWTQRVRIDVEDPGSPVVNHLAPGFEIVEEIYQFRDFSRSRVRVLMTLDTSSIDRNAPGVNRTDKDFALAWVQPFGQGRVFYTALGHFDDTWRDTRFQALLRSALLWVTGQTEIPMEVRPPTQPRILADNVDHAIGNAATLTPRAISPGSVFTIYGESLTPGSEAAAVTPDAPRKLAGTAVLINGEPAPLLYASPRQVNAVAPMTLNRSACRHPAGQCIQVDVVSSGQPAASATTGVSDRTPGVFVTTDNGNGTATVWATGLGAVTASGNISETVWKPKVEINGVSAPVRFSGLAPGWPGLYQINVTLPAGVRSPFDVRLLE